MNRTTKSVAGLLAAAGLLIVTVGCTDMTAKVGGTVFLDGKPIEIGDQQRGMVVFRPVSGGATCTGMIQDGGAFTIATGSSNTMTPGDYLISVRVLELIAPEGNDDKPSGKPVTPAVYADPLTSGLSFVVKNGANRCDLKLESSAGPAVLPKPEPVVEPAVEDELAAEGEPEQEAVDDSESEPAAEEATESEAPEPESETAEAAEAVEESSVEATVEEAVNAP